MIACIDGGLFCVILPALCILFPTLIGRWVKKKYVICVKKDEDCACHPVEKE
jgi:hypothetical protein